MKIEVKGNTNFCLENPEPKFKSYFISGDWGLNFSENKIKWILDDNLLGFIQGDNFYKMCEKIQGCEYSDIKQIFDFYKINLPNYELSIQEIDLIKSVANIFIWVQYFLIDEYDIENDDSLPKVFDDFKIDNNNKITVQKDIYFLPKKYSEENYRNLINNLMNINLLSYFKVSSKNTSLVNYFIPFTKPGFKPNVFQNKETNEFWKTILHDRHIALDNFFNKR